MFTETKNTKQQGSVGLGLAIAHYASRGFIVSIPLNDSQDYDLIVDKGDTLCKVQVKTCRLVERGQYKVTMSMQGGNRKGSYMGKLGTQFRYDILFVVTGDGARYEIPRQAIAHIKTRLMLPSLYARFALSTPS